MAPIKFGVGQSVLRKEDDALIRGKGRYTDDHAPRAALRALVLRSPHAHANFAIDVTRARGLPGVAAMLTAEDVKELGDLPCLFNLEVDPFTGPPYPILAQGLVRHVGDAVAFVVAETARSGPRCAGSHRGRLDGAACRGRCRQCGQEGRAARSGSGIPATCCSTCRSATRKATEAAAFAKAACGGRSVDRQSAHRPRISWKRVRWFAEYDAKARSSDADDRQPGQPSPARNHRRDGAEDPAGKRCG